MAAKVLLGGPNESAILGLIPLRIAWNLVCTYDGIP